MFTQILVPLDGSELAGKALPVAQELGRTSNATIHLIQVVSRQPELEAVRGTDSTQIAEYQMDAARQLVEGRITQAKAYLEQTGSTLRSAGVETNPEYTVDEGDAAERIVDYAKAHSIDLVVMSTHGYGGVRRLLLGSVTDRVIRSCLVPVLVVPCS